MELIFVIIIYPLGVFVHTIYFRVQITTEQKMLYVHSKQKCRLGAGFQFTDRNSLVSHPGDAYTETPWFAQIVSV